MATAGDASLDTILDALGETLNSLKCLLGELSPDDWQRPTGCPSWDVHDVVSHVVGFEARLIAGSETAEGAEHGAVAVVPGAKEATNAKIASDVESRRDRTPEELVEEFSVVTAASMALRRASDRRAGEITDGPFGWQLPYDQLLSIRIFDCVAHEQDVRRAVGRPGGLDGGAAAIVEAFVLERLNGVLRKRVPAVKDHPVTIEITDRGAVLVLGDTEPESTTAAGDTASNGNMTEKEESAAGEGPVGRSAGGPGAAATLRLPFSELLALACGRADVVYELVSLEGDEALARDVLARTGFTP